MRGARNFVSRKFLSIKFLSDEENQYWKYWLLLMSFENFAHFIAHRLNSFFLALQQEKVLKIACNTWYFRSSDTPETFLEIQSFFDVFNICNEICQPIKQIDTSNIIWQYDLGSTPRLLVGLLDYNFLFSVFIISLVLYVHIFFEKFMTRQTHALWLSTPPT